MCGRRVASYRPINVEIEGASGINGMVKPASGHLWRRGDISASPNVACMKRAVARRARHRATRESRPCDIARLPSYAGAARSPVPLSGGGIHQCRVGTQMPVVANVDLLAFAHREERRR